MDAPRGRRGRRPARGHGRRADVIQDPPAITDPPFASIAQDPSIGGPLVRDPLVHVVAEPNDIDEVIVGCVV
ncbi:hypothetical protein V6N13_042835 [Hibiscus sabdariffa]